MGGTRKLLQPVLGFVRESREELSLERSWAWRGAEPEEELGLERR